MGANSRGKNPVRSSASLSRCSRAVAGFGRPCLVGPPGAGGVLPRAGCRRVSAVRVGVLGLVVFFVSLVFVCGSCGVVAVSARSGRRLSRSAVAVACRFSVVSRVGALSVPAWRVRRLCRVARAVRRGRRAGLRPSVPVVVRAVSRVFARVVGLRAVRLGARPRFSLRPGLLSLRAFWCGLPPRACGRVGVVRSGAVCRAWVCVRVVVAGRVWGAVWLRCRVAGGLWPVVRVVGGGGGGGSGRPSVFSASGAGSVLWLASPAVVSAVAGGACPVSLALSVFRWPVRSAVLWSLWAGLLRSRVGGFSGVPSGVLSSFLREALRALGWRFSASRGVPPRFSRSCVVRDFLRLRFGVAPVSALAFLRPSVSFSSSAVVSGLRSVSRCLAWLSARSAGRVSCPPALRPALASLALEALWLLSRRG